MKHSSKRSGRSQRNRKRGAAMVEAIVIMLTMLTFLGMNLFAVKAYGGKLDQSTAVRRDVMYYATHNCAQNNGSDPDTYTSPTLRSAGGAQGNGGFVQDIAALVQTIAGRGSLQSGTATGTKSGFVSGDAVVWTSKRYMVSSMRSASTVVCNEKPYYGGLLSTLASLSWDFIKGLKNLF